MPQKSKSSYGIGEALLLLGFLLPKFFAWATELKTSTPQILHPNFMRMKR